MSQHFKVDLLTAALVCTPLLLFAQDTLITFSGDTSLVLIEQYDEEDVFFRRLDSRESLRQLGMRFVSHILYQDQQNNTNYYSGISSDYLRAIDTSAMLVLVTVNKETYIGRIISIHNDTVQFESERTGLVNIPRQKISRVELAAGNQILRDRTVWRQHPKPTHYFWSPSGYGLSAGEVSYQNFLIVYNQINFGITDRFSMGAFLFPFLNPFSEDLLLPVLITPKVAFPVVEDKFNLSGGAILGTVFGERRLNIALAYGSATYGNRSRNISLGIGYGGFGGKWSKAPSLSLSGLFRVSQKTSLLTENLLISTSEESMYLGFLSIGARTIWPKGTLDYGVFFPVGLENAATFSPCLGFSLPLNKRK